MSIFNDAGKFFAGGAEFKQRQFFGCKGFQQTQIEKN